MQGTEQKAGRKGLARLRAGLWVAAGVSVLIALAVIYDRGHPPGDPASQYASAFGGPFVLTAPDGSSVTDKTLAGKPYAIFFGFTRCPDVCPTSLARMARLRKQLGPDGAKFNIVFVSVDPGHDKPADIGNYVALFGTPIIGLTGTEAQLAQIKKGYGVYSAKVPQPGGDYTIDHTAAIYLMTARGEFSGTIDAHEPDATALAKLKRLIG
ncbi:SCO family protein [Novosphingobium sp. THN1]|jgi:protein SCO1/2|uniref:SCO family protein n=1 Tax=Sphingomonadales TaxID=204457 RepID=UPI000E4E0280|nr:MULTISPECIES: SCO family protein [Sphingomonadales]AXU20494.1 SCO family protein [Novosphingobium sp. THN1]WBX85572.1 SCO family protein [Sphingosinicella microcystinivorans]